MRYFVISVYQQSLVNKPSSSSSLNGRFCHHALSGRDFASGDYFQVTFYGNGHESCVRRQSLVRWSIRKMFSRLKWSMESRLSSGSPSHTWVRETKETKGDLFCHELPRPLRKVTMARRTRQPATCALKPVWLPRQRPV
jgi:hypothetical protein